MTPAEMCNPCVRYDVTHVPGLYTHKGRGGEIHSVMLAYRCGPVPMNRDKAILETVR